MFLQGGDTTRTRSEFENELNGNMVQFTRIIDENITGRERLI